MKYWLLARGSPVNSVAPASHAALRKWYADLVSVGIKNLPLRFRKTNVSAWLSYFGTLRWNITKEAYPFQGLRVELHAKQ
jgi:hypothetical protein